MTEERKQELRRLLEEALAPGNLKILYYADRNRIYDDRLSIPRKEYQRYLKERWDSFSEEPLWFYFFVRPHLENETIESKLLEFILVELAPFVEENSVFVANYTMYRDDDNMIRLMASNDGKLWLDGCLNHLLRVAIVCGAEEAASVFELCTRNNGPPFHFQHVVSLAGIKLESENNEKIVCKGARLVAVPDSGGLPHQLENLVPFHDMQENIYQGKTLLIIDSPVFCIFHRPSRGAVHEANRIDKLPFQLHLDDEEFTDSSAVDSFVELFSQALSLTLDTAVQKSGGTWHFDERKFLQPSGRGGSRSRRHGPFARAKKAGEAEIDEAIRLYEVLKEKQGLGEKLQIPIDRWIRSKVPGRHVDKIIDLGIALEALYLSDISEPTELSFRLRLHAAWHLRENEEDRKQLMKEFRGIYDWRSSAVHKGKIPNKTKNTSYTEEEVAAFIQRSQDLCRESILKILEDGEFPMWNRLILGGDP